MSTVVSPPNKGRRARYFLVAQTILRCLALCEALRVVSFKSGQQHWNSDTFRPHRAEQRAWSMIVTRDQELAEVLNRVKLWPLPMRITLARRILETTETSSIPEPPRTLSLDQVLGLLKTDVPPPTDEECENHRRRAYEEIWMIRVLLDTNVILDVLFSILPSSSPG